MSLSKFPTHMDVVSPPPAFPSPQWKWRATGRDRYKRTSSFTTDNLCDCASEITDTPPEGSSLVADVLPVQMIGNEIAFDGRDSIGETEYQWRFLETGQADLVFLGMSLGSNAVADGPYTQASTQEQPIIDGQAVYAQNSDFEPEAILLVSEEEGILFLDARNSVLIPNQGATYVWRIYDNDGTTLLGSVGGPNTTFDIRPFISRAAQHFEVVLSIDQDGGCSVASESIVIDAYLAQFLLRETQVAITITGGNGTIDWGDTTAIEQWDATSGPVTLSRNYANGGLKEVNIYSASPLDVERIDAFENGIEQADILPEWIRQENKILDLGGNRIDGNTFSSLLIGYNAGTISPGREVNLAGNTFTSLTAAEQTAFYDLNTVNGLTVHLIAYNSETYIDNG